MRPPRPPRLAAFDYTGMHRYSITACTFGRRPTFDDPAVVADVLLQLRSSAAREGFALLAYCFMKDHLHILATGQRTGADLLRFMARFRQASGYRYSRTTGGRLWQEGYYERVRREEDDTKTAIRYILGNPVRAGLTRTIGEYAGAGSDVYRVEEIVGDLAEGLG